MDNVIHNINYIIVLNYIIIVSLKSIENNNYIKMIVIVTMVTRGGACQLISIVLSVSDV